MDQINIQLPDGSEQSYDKGVLPIDIAKNISKSLGKKAIAAKFQSEIVELNRPLTESGVVEILTAEDEDALFVLRHSAAHLMAQALTRLYPNINFGVGPAIENGFYYDVDAETSITEEDLKTITM